MGRKGTCHVSFQREALPDSVSTTGHWLFHVALFTGANSSVLAHLFRSQPAGDMDIILFRYITFCFLELMDLLI